jgi:hypothetical protein
MIPAAGTIRLKTISGKIVEVLLRPKTAPERPNKVDRLSKKREKRGTKSPEPKVFRHRPFHSRYFQGTPKVPMNISECKARQPINQSS